MDKVTIAKKHVRNIRIIKIETTLRPFVVVVVPFIFISHFSSVRNNFTRAQGPVIVIAKEEI